MILRQKKILNSLTSIDDIDEVVQAEFERMVCDLSRIYRRDWNEQYDVLLEEIIPGFSKELGLLSTKLNAMVSDMGFEKSLSYISPWKIDYNIRSRELMLKGRIDKVMQEKCVFPVIIKSGSPKNISFINHSLDICAYSLLLEERYQVLVDHGFIEYARIHELRPILNTEKNRRSVIEARDNVLAVIEGDIPEVCSHGSSKKCSSCDLADECYTL